MRYWVGSWVWVEDEIGKRWMPPAGAVGCLDLRSLQDQGAPGPVAGGSGFFTTPDDVELDGYTDVPDQISEKSAGRIASAIGVESVAATTRAELVEALLTDHGDPTGATFAPPLMPDKNGVLKYSVGEHAAARQLTQADPHFPKVLAVIQETYRGYKARANDPNDVTPPDLHQMALTVWKEQLGIKDTAIFIPDDLPVEEAKPHKTTLTENFNTADSSTLGPTYSWQDTADNIGSDTFNVASNRCACKAGIGSTYTSVALADVSSSNHECQIDAIVMSAGNAQTGVLVRADISSAVNAYVGRLINNVVNRVDICKLVAGVLTDLGTQSFSFSTPDTLLLRANGSTLTLFVNGVSQISLTDTTFSGGTRGGVWGYNSSTDTTSVQMDDWSLSDLSAFIAGKPFTRLQAVNRAGTY